MHTIRKFIDYYAPYKTVFFIDLVCAAFISIVDLAYPQILRTMTNTLFTRGSSEILATLPWIAAGLLLMYILQSLCKYYVSYQGHMMGANMERDMRQQLFDHYERQYHFPCFITPLPAINGTNTSFSPRKSPILQKEALRSTSRCLKRWQAMCRI